MSAAPRQPENPALPLDLAEWLGAVRLMQVTLEAVQEEGAPAIEFRAGPGREGFPVPMLLTFVVYAYCRGVYGSEELEERARSDADLRYLCAGDLPDAVVLRQFRRREWTRVRRVLAEVLERVTGAGDGDGWFQPEAEAETRLSQAIAADSLAWDD